MQTQTHSGDANGSGVARELRNVASDVGDMIKSSSLLNGEELDRIKTKLNEQVVAAKQYFETTSAELSERARNSVKLADTYVHDKPWQSIGIGAALGFVIGLVLARRN